MKRKPPSPPVAGQLLFSVPQAAMAVSLSQSYMWRLVSEGKIRTRLKGTRRLIHRDDLEKFARLDEKSQMKNGKI